MSTVTFEQGGSFRVIIAHSSHQSTTATRQISAVCIHYIPQQQLTPELRFNAAGFGWKSYQSDDNNPATFSGADIRGASWRRCACSCILPSPPLTPESRATLSSGSTCAPQNDHASCLTASSGMSVTSLPTYPSLTPGPRQAQAHIGRLFPGQTRSTRYQLEGLELGQGGCAGWVDAFDQILIIAYYRPRPRIPSPGKTLLRAPTRRHRKLKHCRQKRGRSRIQPTCPFQGQPQRPQRS